MLNKTVQSAELKKKVAYIMRVNEIILGVLQ